MQHIACAKGQAILPGSRLEPSYLFLPTAEAGSRGGGGGEGLAGPYLWTPVDQAQHPPDLISLAGQSLPPDFCGVR